MDLLDRIGRELQARWTYSGIDQYLKQWDVDITKETSPANSKWVYSKELLADESDEKLIEIADELDIEHGYVAANTIRVEPTFWRPGYFRLFLSHTSAHKAKVAQLQSVLLRHGISGFVAHEDIEPTKEWLFEIEKALMSMDALAAVLTPDFNQSSWTDHEVGVAVGREVPVIPIRKGLDPYGFIGRYQGLQAQGLTIGQVSIAIGEILASNQRTKGRYPSVLIGLLLDSQTPETVEHWLSEISTFKSPPVPVLERLRANALSNPTIAGDSDLIARINQVLQKYSVEGLTLPITHEADFDDDIPF